MTGLLAASLFLLAAPAPKAEVQVLEALPKKFAADGDLAEWKDLASTSLHAANQVAGPAKVSGDADFTAVVWVAFTKDGVAVAGQVSDDKVKLADSSKMIHADHAELWLALPAAPMPPLAFANQFGEIEVPDADSCDSLEEIEDPAACKAWVKEQRARRTSLERLFVRQYLFSTSGVEETWSTQPGKDGKAPEAPQRGCCKASKAVVKAAAGGWVFEAWIDVLDFPATTQVPLRDLALLVDIADADDQTEKLESFLSTSPRRKLGRPTTFSAVTLKEPLLWETDPPLLARFAKGHSIFYFPAKPMPAAYYFVNPPVGYQYSPSQPSPAVVTMKYGDPPVAKLGDLSVYWAESPHGHGLYSVRNGVVLDGIPNEGKLVTHVNRGADTLQFVIANEGTVSALGTGACGACPLHDLAIFSLDKTGSFKTLLEEQIAESVPGDDGNMLEGLKLEHDKDLGRIGYVGKTLDADGNEKPFKTSWKWDAARKTFVPEKK